ncbi:hypothetical protein [Hyunsoonleella rubra]|uniref:Lipoprotein n=1 Tax=Hyunsoonleella rubra TaxID=1737062 RepID=A0ABW5T866_9FLAO
MKTSICILSFLTLIIFSCGQQKENNDYAEFGYDSNTYFEDEAKEFNKAQPVQNNARPNGTLKGYKVMSKQFGMPVGVMPIPNSWQVSNNKQKGILFESNDGVKVYGERFISHFFSNNQELNYISQQNGSRVAPPKDLNRVLQEDIIPYAQQQGLKLVNQFQLPALARFDKQFDSYLFKGMPENKQYQCVATEWVDQKGEKSIGIIRYFTNHYPTTGGMDWGYTLNAMGAPANAYEGAKKAFINSLVNFQINPQWVQANNQYYAQLSGQSAAAHQQRMSNIKAQGQAILNNGRTYSSITDSNHESWKRRNAMNDAGHSSSINNGIWERTTISNPSTGQQYYAEGQNDYYWVNQNNEYYGTNDANYNPNIDNSMNNQDWTQYNIQQ